jgi:peptidoglycan DL-endopeptidase CwlO
MKGICTLLVAMTAAGLSVPAATAAADTASADPGQQLAGLNKQLDSDQATLNDLNDRVERAHADLDALNRKLEDDHRRLTELSQRLSQVARIEYERPALSLSTILGARSLGQLLAEVAQARLVALKQQALVSEAESLRRQDEQARDQEAGKLAEIMRAREQATQIAAQTLGLRDSVQDAAVRARASAVAAQAQASAALPTAPPPPQTQTIAPPAPSTQAAVPQAPAIQTAVPQGPPTRTTAPAAPPAQPKVVPPARPNPVPAPTRATQPAAPKATPAAPTGGPLVFQPPGGNHFAFGYCTWYVAGKLSIPWFGNAIQWWSNAAAYGYAEGQVPRVGAVMVTRESAVYGHVAYVESVNGDGSWTVSEMNYSAWNVVDTRTIRPGQVPLVGFIYGKAG